MQVVSISEIRKNAEQILESVNVEASAAVITYRGKRKAYLVDAALFEENEARIDELSMLLNSIHKRGIAD